MSGVSVHQLPQVPGLPLSSCTRILPSVSNSMAPAPMLGTLLTGCHDVPPLPLCSCTGILPWVGNSLAPAPMLGRLLTGCHDCALATVTAANSTIVANPSIRKSFIFLLFFIWLLQVKAGSEG